ncbi:MAG: SpoIIE family protein phosphatase [Anaerolineae bacterium]
MTPIDPELLRGLAFLREADPEVLRALAGVAREKRFRPGEVILEEGSSGRELYLIVEGRVEAVKTHEGDEVLLAIRGPGELLGEMALIEEKPRSATVRAVAPTRVLEVSEPDLRALLAKDRTLLYEAARVLSARLRQGDLARIAQLQRKNRELAQAYRELQEAQAALVEKERLEHELDLARELQQSILPHTFPDLPGVTCAAESRPARQVGGDFYDVISLSDMHTALVMADVSDKGMSAALYMALTRSLIRAEARHHRSPREVLLSTNRLLMEMSQATMFVTVFYGVLDLSNSTLLYTRAGHDYPLLFDPHTGECRVLTGQGVVLGCVEEVNLEELSVDLSAGSLLVLYTDGITDANSDAGEFFGPERLQETVCAAGGLSAQGVCDFVFNSVDRFQAGAVQYDDMALLVARME